MDSITLLVCQKHILALPFFGTKIPDWPWTELENFQFDPVSKLKSLGQMKFYPYFKQWKNKIAFFLN